ncbi:hypothetical protein E1301_Tti023704 [Triplophysa tibetana]|uniref:Uncharacterized protein n=1 Tax=Triplophysa tibetana TaxID=1572043 RepID=A0A5A9PGS4_9TELE|nr:hypothetical protein E1301_Tti023704 [Triplophysa tibetana]
MASPTDQLHQTLKRHLLEELLSKFERALLRSPLDPEDIEFVCRQQLYLMQALSRHVEIPIYIIQALQEVFEIVRQPPYSTAPHAMVVTTTGLRGRPRRMKDFGLSISDLYSSITDEELDNSVRAIKDEMPASGYRMDIEEADLDWDVAASYEACEDLGVVVPEFECPLSSDGLNGLEDLQNLTGSNTPATEMYLLCREFVTTNIV